MSRHALLWLRRDLRTDDQPALAAALDHGRVTAIHVDDRQPDGEGEASRWWLGQSLDALEQQLATMGIELLQRGGESGEQLIKAARSCDANHVYATARIEPAQRRLEQNVSQLLADHSITLHLAPPSQLVMPGNLLNREGLPYRVFTPFWRTLSDHLHQISAGCPPAANRTPSSPPAATGSCEWERRLARDWFPGEEGAWQQLQRVIENGVVDHYHLLRDRPDHDATSRLSPHLHFGEISPRRLLSRLLPLDHDPERREGAMALIRQLGWREFAGHLLWHFPESAVEPLNPRYRNSPLWNGDRRLLTAWQRGESGIDLVDAGMRELWQRGWMHNRTRMVVASMLTKNLAIHWLEGAHWFEQTLVDADLANNTLGWQWVAGCGADAAPYHRIFNPQRQAERFDPHGDYRQRWLGNTPRPPPVVDLASTRRQALTRFRTMDQQPRKS